jgi:RNA polymerase sigma-70 factor (ECF subfamily)
MPDELAQVVVYAYVDEMTHQEIADVLRCSRRQVGNLLQRALELVGAEETVS